MPQEQHSTPAQSPPAVPSPASPQLHQVKPETEKSLSPKGVEELPVTSESPPQALSCATPGTPTTTPNSGNPASGQGLQGSGNSSGSEGRKISCEDIQLVQNLIERCLQLYMNQREVISTLQYQAKIEPGFTSLVWQKLEEQNPDFFRAYYARLKVKEQMQVFNQLLEQHSQLLVKMRMGAPPLHKMGAPPPAPGVPAAAPSPMHPAPMGYPMHCPPPAIGAPANGHSPVAGHPAMHPHGPPMRMPHGGAHRPMPPMANGVRPHGPLPQAYGHHPAQGTPAAPDLMGMPALGIPSQGMAPGAHPPPMHTANGFHTPNGGARGIGNGTGRSMGPAEGGLLHENGTDTQPAHSDGGTPGGHGPAFPFGSTELGPLGLGLTPLSTSMGVPLAMDGSPFGSAGTHAGGDGEGALVNVASREVLGSLGHLPRNFSLSDLAADFPSGLQTDAGLLGSLTGSPTFMASDSEAYLHSPGDEDGDKLIDLDLSDIK